MEFFEKHKKLSVLIGAVLAIIILMIASTFAKEKSFIAKNVFNTLVLPLQKGVATVADGVGGFFGFLFEMSEYKEENTRLAKENVELMKKYRGAQDYKTENERLAGLLEIKNNDFAPMNTTGARVVGWSTDNWFNYYTIDKGSLDGVRKKCMVVTDEGLVGHISDVGTNWSRVITIVDASSSVGARVVRTGDVALVVGDNIYEKQGLCKMTFINKESQIVVGDIIETSGLGGVYAPGFAIGRVKEIVADSTGVSQHAVIEPLVNFRQTHHVLIVLDEIGASGALE